MWTALQSAVIPAFCSTTADGRTLVLRDIVPFANPFYRNHAGAGPLFVEDVSGAGYSFAPGTQVWARQFNAEGGTDPKVVNDGGSFWALGWKTEGGETLLENKNGGRSELWGVLAYTFGVGHDKPAFLNSDAGLALQMTGMTYMGANGFYDLLVRDTQGGATKEVRRDAGTSRGGMTLPLYVSGPAQEAKPQKETTMKKTPMAVKSVLIAAAAVTAAGLTHPVPVRAEAPAPSGKVYKAPEFMDGEKQGTAAGNPLEVAGKPLWRLDQIWPDDPLNHDDYKPLLWAGDHWDGAYDFGGQPGAKVEAGKITLAVRGSWGGGGTMPGGKFAALVFLAPAKGHIIRSLGTVRAGVWQGDGSVVSLSVLKYDPLTKKVTRLNAQSPTPKDTDVKLADIAADLDAGQELILAPLVGAMYTAANVELTGFQIQAAAPPLRQKWEMF